MFHNKKAAEVNQIIGIIVVVVIAIAVALNLFWDLAVTQQSPATVGLEQFTTSTNSTEVSLRNDKIVPNSETVYNSTASGDLPLARNTEYLVDYTNGQIVVYNKTQDTVTYNISYQYYPDAYAGGTTSTIIGLIPILFAIIVLILVSRFMGGKQD